MHPRLVGAIGLYCGNDAIAEELAQEALIRACSRWKSVRAMNSPEGWLHRVGFNLANSYFRRAAAERRARTRLEGFADRPATADLAEVVSLREALAQLPRRQRAVLVLRFYADMRFTEIASVLECPESTAKSLARRGLDALRKDPLIPGAKEAGLV